MNNYLTKESLIELLEKNGYDVKMFDIVDGVFKGIVLYD